MVNGQVDTWMDRQMDTWMDKQMVGGWMDR